MEKKLKRILHEGAAALPVQAFFWNIAFHKELKKERVISSAHRTSEYTLHTFYKPISIHLNLKIYDTGI
ncbi:MAG TPA: hypothetical protein VGO45_06995 [Bacteroidia bacterium]|nr:hypothetical protein [Bacteroidia bacterium]